MVGAATLRYSPSEEAHCFRDKKKMSFHSGKSKVLRSQSDLSRCDQQQSERNPQQPSLAAPKGSLHTQACPGSSAGCKLPSSGTQQCRNDSDIYRDRSIEAEPNAEMEEVIEENKSRIGDLERQVDDLSGMLETRRGKISKRRRQTGKPANSGRRRGKRAIQNTHPTDNDDLIQIKERYGKPYLNKMPFHSDKTKHRSSQSEHYRR